MKIKRQRKKNGFRIGWKDFFLYGFLFLFLLFLTIGIGDFSYGPQQQDVSLSQTLADVKANKISEIVVSDNKMDVNYKNGKKAVTKKEPGTSLYEVFKDSGVDPSKVKITMMEAE